MPNSLDEISLCSITRRVLRAAEIDDYTSLQNLLESGGVSAIIKKLLNIPDDSRLSGYAKRNTVVIFAEIITMLAINGVDVSTQIQNYINELICEDARYSVVRFWKSLRRVLFYLPDKKYTKLKGDNLEKFEKAYEYAARYILETNGETAREVLPSEDYNEIVCSTCGHITSFFFTGLFAVECKFCEARREADYNGFDLCTLQECEDNGIDLSEFDEDEIEDDDVFFVCRLCNTVSEFENLTSSELLSLKQTASRQCCRNCVGEKYLLWLAEKTGNTIEFDKPYIYFTESKTNKTVPFYKEELRPQKIWQLIFDSGEPM